METGRAKKVDLHYFHLLVVALLILGFGYLPTFSTVTPYGMKALGCLWLGFCRYAANCFIGSCFSTVYWFDYSRWFD